jgi:hypothetical protein
MPCEGIEDFRIVIGICCVWEKVETHIDQHISKTQTIWQLSAGDEKTNPAKKVTFYRTRPLDSILT